MSPKCLHCLNSYELVSDSERGKTVEFPSLCDMRKALARRSTQFHILDTPRADVRFLHVV